MLTTAFAPFSFFPSAFIAIALMLRVWRHSSPVQAGWCGYVFGLAYFGSSIYWIYYSLHDFGGASAGFSLLATGLLIALLAGYFMLLGWVVSYVARMIYPTVFSIGVYPMLWVLFEWMRSVLLTGFPWNLAGQALIDSPFAETLVWGGTLGASWLVALVAGVLGVGFQAGRKKMLAAVYLLAGGLLLLVWSSSAIEWTRPSGPAVKVGIVQGGIAQDLKFDKAVFKDIVLTYRQLTDRVADSQLVVWPETAIPASYGQLEEAVLMPVQAAIAAAGGGDLITGVFSREGERYRNSLVKVAPPPLMYHKRHLVPFGEYMPLRGIIELFRSYVTMPMSDLKAGDQSPLLSVGQYQVAVSICYEAIFGGTLIKASPRADYLINISNDSWFGDSIARHQHLQMARLRAIESGRAMVRATSTGISAAIGHKGEIIAQSEGEGASVVTAFIQPRQGLTPYARWSRWPGHQWLIAVAALLGVIVCFIISGKFRLFRADIR